MAGTARTNRLCPPNASIAKLITLDHLDTPGIEQMRDEATARELGRADCGKASRNAAIVPSSTGLVRSTRSGLTGSGASDHCPAEPCLSHTFRTSKPSAGAAMQRHSWTNNGWPIFFTPDFT